MIFADYPNGGLVFRQRESDALFESPKILTPQLQNFPHFTLDSDKWYPDAGGYSLVKKAGAPEDYGFLLGVMNSSVLWFIKNTSNAYNKNYYYFKTKYLERFFFPLADKAAQSPIVTLVSNILNAKQSDSEANTTLREHEIDRLVFALHDLGQDEIALVEVSKRDGAGQPSKPSETAPIPALRS
jgi:adenine-specific DNA-methyltransferase